VTRTLRIGLAGLGGISRAHLAGYAASEGRAQVVAVCDRDADRADAVARELGARAYADLDDLLADDAVEAVDLTLPHDAHFAAAAAALGAGRHVLCEKPLALTSAECRELIAAARDAGRTLGVAENTRFVTAYVEVEKLLRAGAIGEPRLARTLISGSEVRRLSDPSVWKGRRAGSGGGTIIDAGPHSFYLLRWLLGELETVRAFASRLVAASEVEDHAVVAGRLASGALYTTEYTFTAEIPWGERLELYGSEGSIVVDQLARPPAIRFRGAGDLDGEPLAGVPHAPQTWKRDSIAAGVLDFVDAVLAGREPAVRAEDGLHGVLVAERAYASIAAGGAELPVAEPAPARGGRARRPRVLLLTDVSPYAPGPDGEPRLAGAHGVLGQAARAVREVASACGLGFELAEDLADLREGALEEAAVLALFTIGETPFTDAQRALVERRLAGGELQLLGLHSAADSCASWPAFGRLLGARFDGHPWTQTFAIRRCGEPHPSTARLPDPWRFTDEVYLFRDLRDDARVLLEAVGDDLDMDAPGARRPAHGFPLAWCFTEGRGRVFYTALGHFPGAYEDVRFLAHLHGGLAWLADRGRPE
jgi:predicted dehydrogenase